jgi:O-antigen/teichoic acid export membrane protein
MWSRVLLLTSNAVLGLVIAKLFLALLGQEKYGIAVSLIFITELSAVIAGAGLPYFIEKKRSLLFRETYKIWSFSIFLSLTGAVVIQIVEFNHVTLYLSTMLSLTIFASIVARCCTRLFISWNRLNTSIFSQIFETKISLLLGMSLMYMSSSLGLAMVGYFAGKLIVPLYLLLTSKVGEADEIKIRSSEIRKFWAYELFQLMMANTVVVYMLFFQEFEAASVWIYFIIANALSSIVINASRIRVFSNYWDKKSKVYNKEAEIALLFIATFMSWLVGGQVVDYVFGVGPDSLILVGTLLTWCFYSLMGPQVERYVTEDSNMIYLLVLICISAIILSYSLVFHEIIPLYSLFFIPILMQALTRYARRLSYP